MKYINFKDITAKNIGEKFIMHGRIDVVRQTSGPTLMILSDGTANFTFKAFLKPGERAYPEILQGDYVIVEAQIKERKGGIEGEVLSMRKLAGDEKEKFAEKMRELNFAKFAPVCTTFTIKSKAFEALKERFIKVATLIRRAVVEGRPILLRHNADCDGYSSAITIERAILKFMDEVSGGDKQLPYQNYRRAPSKAPFYEYEDAVKDLSIWLRDKVKNGAKSPLIIITDNGSTEEDLLSIKQMKIYNAKIVVIDHHYPGEVIDGKVKVDEHIDAHVNPYLEGFDSNLCAGMLGFELARFIYKNNCNSIFIPAMAAILDHCTGTERDEYIKIAEKEGFNIQYLQNLGEIIDMQSHFIRFSEAREFIDELFGSNMSAQKKIVKLLSSELERKYDAVDKVAKKYAEIIDMNSFYLVLFDGEKGTFRGGYPSIGKSTNQVHKIFERDLKKPVITTTYGPTFLTIRVSDDIAHFSVPEFVKILLKEVPYINADGGGHERAGSVRFVEYGKEIVLEKFKEYLNKISKSQ